MTNFWDLPQPLPAEEVCEPLLQTPQVLVERIISSGQVTPPGQWYDQPRDEWVLLVQGSATLEFASGETRSLRAGDHLLIPAHQRHRVAFTSQHPPCLWLAIHGALGQPRSDAKEPGRCGAFTARES